MTPEATQLVGTLFSSGIAAFVGYIIAKTNSRTTTNASITAPYGELAERVTTLEQKDEEKSRIISRLRDRLGEEIRLRGNLIAYLRTVIVWAVAGASQPAPPIPFELQAVVDQELFEPQSPTARLVRKTTTTEYSHDPFLDPQDPDLA